MPRLIEERWLGIGYDVVTESLPVADEHGAPRLDEFFRPVLQEMTTLVFTRPTPDGPHIIRIPFDKDSKLELVRKLTGGVIVPSANGNASPL